ncbi:MAG TPA: metalloregulator ArsR/SmtB family transcription factor [Candidatus Limnocylindrales bacterium]|nr:metalloregulator ArsR/SmtB family transcription factor [Candidatus Limnocylindrales bacterium]
MVLANLPLSSADPLSSIFGALADPTRRAILARLADSPDDLTVAQLAAPFPMSQPAISRHLRVLEQAGLISRRRRATARLSQLRAEPLRDASDWLARYQALWNERHGRLDALLVALKEQEQEQQQEGRTDRG